MYVKRSVAWYYESSTWRKAWSQGLESVAEFGPNLLLVSAGFDGHCLDPLGNFPFGEVARNIVELVDGRGVISLLEGGYNLNVLGQSVAAYLEGFLCE